MIKFNEKLVKSYTVIMCDESRALGVLETRAKELIHEITGYMKQMAACERTPVKEITEQTQELYEQYYNSYKAAMILLSNLTDKEEARRLVKGSLN
jgi:N-acetylmuramic acid 6-phosphate (MurNAc-6-P) etherase